MGNTLSSFFRRIIGRPDNTLYINSNWATATALPTTHEPESHGFVPDVHPSFIDTNHHLYGDDVSTYNGTILAPPDNTLAGLPNELLDPLFAPLVADMILASAAPKRLLSTGIKVICENAIPELHNTNRLATIAPGPNLRPVAIRCYFEQTAHETVIYASAHGITVTGTFVETGMFRMHGKRLFVLLRVLDASAIGEVVAQLRDIVVGCEVLRKIVVRYNGARSSLSDAEAGQLKAELEEMIEDNRGDIRGTVKVKGF